MGRVLAFADIHGNRDLWEQIKSYIQPDDQLFFLGDAIDRGPDGYAIMKEMLLDKRIIYIKGNHEDMMEKALYDMKHYHDGAWVGEEFELWIYNGGYSTISAWSKAGAKFGWGTILKRLPLEATYINTSQQTIHLCHAGFSLNNKPDNADDMLWDRDHLLERISITAQEEHTIIVHGHTPTPYLIKRLEEFNSIASQEKQHKFYTIDNVVFYGSGTKIDIDCGTYSTKTAALLDLDTFEVKTFFSV